MLLKIFSPPFKIGPLCRNHFRQPLPPITMIPLQFLGSEPMPVDKTFPGDNPVQAVRQSDVDPVESNGFSKTRGLYHQKMFRFPQNATHCHSLSRPLQLLSLRQMCAEQFFCQFHSNDTTLLILRKKILSQREQTMRGTIYRNNICHRTFAPFHGRYRFIFKLRPDRKSFPVL